MRVIKASVSRFKRRVVKRALKLGSAFEKTRTKRVGYPWSYSSASHDSRNSIRDRGILSFSVLPMGLGFNLDAFLRKRKKAVVFEIGCGTGALLADFRKRYKKNIGKTVGLDTGDFVIRGIKSYREGHDKYIDELRAGDALVASFPKSDLIVSQWTLGYTLNPNFLLKKIEKALKPGGVALIHFNTTGTNITMHWHNEPVAERLFKYLAKGKKIGNSTVKAVKVDKKMVNGIMNTTIEGKLSGKMAPGMKNYFEWTSIGGGGPAWIYLLGNPLILIQKPKK